VLAKVAFLRRRSDGPCDLADEADEKQKRPHGPHGRSLPAPSDHALADGPDDCFGQWLLHKPPASLLDRF
jgi:hypothetical protein